MLERRSGDVWPSSIWVDRRGNLPCAGFLLGYSRYELDLSLDEVITLANPRQTCITGSPCGDPTCYRGGVGDWNYQFKDGPCAAPDCAWPKGLPARPHFTDTPATPIVDAGRVAREALAADAAADAHAQQICDAEDRRVMRAITEPMTRPLAVSPPRMTATDVNRAYNELQRQIREAFDERTP